MDNSTFMLIIYSYLDRINVSNARLAGMQSDLHMSDTVWSAGISLFYVGYIISQVPANVLIARGKPSIIFPSLMLVWSAVTICMPALSSGWAFCLCRFLVGFAEGPFVPAVSLLTSSWYTKKESPLRMGIWHAGNIISNVFSSLLAAAILTNMNGIAKLRAWQWFILLEGIVSILVAVMAFWFIPNFPNNTSRQWFTEEEAAMAQYRQVVSAGGVLEDDEGEGNAWGGVLLAIKDPFTALFSAIHFSLIIAQSFKDFFPSVRVLFSVKVIANTARLLILSVLMKSSRISSRPHRMSLRMSRPLSSLGHQGGLSIIAGISSGRSLFLLLGQFL